MKIDLYTSLALGSFETLTEGFLFRVIVLMVEFSNFKSFSAIVESLVGSVFNFFPFSVFFVSPASRLRALFLLLFAKRLDSIFDLMVGSSSSDGFKMITSSSLKGF